MRSPCIRSTGAKKRGDHAHARPTLGDGVHVFFCPHRARMQRLPSTLDTLAHASSVCPTKNSPSVRRSQRGFFAVDRCGMVTHRGQEIYRREGVHHDATGRSDHPRWCTGRGPASAGAGTDGQGRPKKTADAWEAFKDYTHEKKDAAVTHGKQLMRETDAKIKQFAGKASKASGDAQVAYEKEIKTLKAQRAEAGKKLNEMGKASASSWDAVTQGFAAAYRDLYHSYEKAVAKLK